MDKALKQRLVGASVIIALAIIVLPMLLSGIPESGSGQTQIMEVPPRPDGLSFETRRFPVADGGESGEHPASVAATTQNPRPVLPTAKPADSGEDTGATATSPAATERSTPEAGPAVTPESAAVLSAGSAADQQVRDSGQEAPATISPAETTSPGGQVQTGVETVVDTGVDTGVDSGGGPASNIAVQAVAPRLEGGGRYVVQVASLSSAENASKLEARLQKQGYAVLRDTVESDLGRLNRVRVGPFEKEAEAVEASARIKTEFTGVSPRILDLQPELTAPVTIPNDPLVRWVVQLGVFADSGNAQKLVAQLIGEGLTAYSETVSGKSAITHRVRVGPFLEHDEAIRTRQQLAERQNIEGVVMTAD